MINTFSPTIKLYIHTPTFPTLLTYLANKYCISSIADATVVISEDIPSIFPDKLNILLSDSDKQSDIVIDVDLPLEIILTHIDVAITTYQVTMQKSQLVERSSPRDEMRAKKLEDILNASKECILDVSIDGNILFYNRRFKELYSLELPFTDDNLFSICDANTSSFFRAVFLENNKIERREFLGALIKKDKSLIHIEGQITLFSDDTSHFEITFESVQSKMASELRIRKIEEQSLVAGFSRHLSHNVMNALTAAGGFIRQIRAKADADLHTQNLWKIIDTKLQLIEEVVAGYNDYTHSLSFKLQDDIDISEFFQQEIIKIAEKNIDRNFTAYLNRFTDSFSLTYDFSETKPYPIKANKLFLRLGLCYVIKDNIRFFEDYVPLKFHIKLSEIDTRFAITISILDIEISDHILDTMLQPWNHNMLSQSFDYWGVVIANMVVERHNGSINITKLPQGISITLLF